MKDSHRCVLVGAIAALMYFFSTDQFDEAVLMISAMVMFAASAICRAIEKQ